MCGLLNEVLTRHVVKAQLTRHTHTRALAYAHRQAPANKTHTHTTASGRHCCKPSLFCACSLCPLHSLLARQQAASLSSFYFPTHFPPSLLMAHTWYILTFLFLSAHSCFAVCTAFIKASGRIPAIAMGPDQLGKSRRRLRGGVGIEGAHVATEGLGVRPTTYGIQLEAQQRRTGSVPSRVACIDTGSAPGAAWECARP